jgi:hypothetical protein
MELSKTVQTNDNIRGVSTLAYGGSLWVTNLAGTLAVGDNFKLFGAAGYNGSFASLNLPPLNAGLGWQFTTTNGTLSVVAVAMSPANIIAVAMGNSLELSWPTQYTGWRLEVQTNALRAGLGAIWFDVPNSAFTNRVVIPIDPGNESVFYRLVAP